MAEKSVNLWKMTDVKKCRYGEEQIIGFLKQAEAGMPVKEPCRKAGFSDTTAYKPRTKFGGMDLSDYSGSRFQDTGSRCALSSRQSARS